MDETGEVYQVNKSQREDDKHQMIFTHTWNIKKNKGTDKNKTNP